MPAFLALPWSSVDGSSGSSGSSGQSTLGFYDLSSAKDLLKSSARNLLNRNFLNDYVSSVESESNDIVKYFDGLMTNQGLENEENRKFNSAEALKNREFQHDEALLQRNWYEDMSSSAYQRAVKDMKAAGLNPILAYQQGGAASAGTGVPAGSAAGYTATGGDTLSSLLSSMADVISSLTGASASKVDSAWKIFKMVMR